MQKFPLYERDIQGKAHARLQDEEMIIVFGISYLTGCFEQFCIAYSNLGGKVSKSEVSLECFCKLRPYLTVLFGP